MNVLCYDYSGYGLSAGKATEKALYSNVRDVWRFAVQRLQVPPKSIVLVSAVESPALSRRGLSEKRLPSPPKKSACSTATVSGPRRAATSQQIQRPFPLEESFSTQPSPQVGCPYTAPNRRAAHPSLSAYLLQKTAMSAIAAGLRLFISDMDRIPWFDAFTNERKIAQVEGCPVFLIHGRNDSQVLKAPPNVFSPDVILPPQTPERGRVFSPASSQVPLAHSLLLEAAARKRAANEERIRTWWVPNADHNDVEQKAGVRTPQPPQRSVQERLAEAASRFAVCPSGRILQTDRRVPRVLPTVARLAGPLRLVGMADSASQWKEPNRVEKQNSHLLLAHFPLLLLGCLLPPSC